MPAFEYTRIPWDEVAGYAAQGWRLMPIPPMPEMKAVLGQVQMTGVILYHMERETRGGATTAGMGPVASMFLPEPRR